MTKLITGGTGFIGAELARVLVGQGERVVVFDIAPNYARLDGIENQVKVVQGNLANWHEVLNVVKENDIEGIYHLGSMLSVPSEANPWASFQVNVCGTMYVLEAARLFGVKTIVFSSTSATYTLGVTEVINDETIQRPTTMYGCGKTYCELLGRFYRRKFGLDFRSLRYPSVVGPGVKTPGIAQFYSWMIEHTAQGKAYECYVTEEAKMPIIYSKDAVKSANMLYQAPKEQINTVNYNVAGVRPILSTKEVELAIKKYIPKVQVTYKPDPEIMEFYRTFNVQVFDDSKAREEWGWTASYSDFDKLVVDFIEEMHSHPKRYGITNKVFMAR